MKPVIVITQLSDLKFHDFSKNSDESIFVFNTTVKICFFGGFFPHWLPSDISLQHRLWWACWGRNGMSNRVETDMHTGGLPYQEYLAIKSTLVPA